ncbi:MAG TPA: helix-turn-helix domain-containing protein [Pilimelia sp.]|nr:helix-turn-helix domain-containing protein [Pilimelia sp.]
MTDGRLTALLGATVRRQRELHRLTQQQLAARSGVSQGAIARIERGQRAASLHTVERLLAALGAQLTVGVEPLDAHIDAAIAELATTPFEDRIAETDIDRVMDRLGDLPYVFDGPTAALLQGAPVPAEAVDLALAWQDVDAFTEWLTANYGQRWNAPWQQFGYLRLDPREPGEVHHGARSYRVVPLAEVHIDDPRVVRLLDRYRATRARPAQAVPS